MGIQVQICGLILLLTVLILWILQPRIRLQTQRMYAALIISGIICLFLDGYSILVIQNSGEHFGLYEQFFCKAYLISLDIMACFSFLYLTAELETHISYIKYMRKISYVWGTIFAALIFILPIYVNNDSQKVFTYGASVYATYVAAGVLVIVNFVILVWHRRHMDSHRWLAGMIWQVLWIGATVIQLINGELLLVGYAASIGITIIFIKLENPEGYLDRTTGAFNEQALRLYVDENYKQKKDFQILTVVFEQINYQDEVLSLSEKDILLRQIALYFREIKRSEGFKHAGWEYTIIFYDKETMKRVSQEIEEKFSDAWNVNGKRVLIDIIIMELPDSSIASMSEQLFEMSRSFIEYCKRYALKGIQSLDDKWVAQINKDNETAVLIQEAINDGRVEVFYQPIYSTSEKRFVSAEALARIRNVDGSIMMPGIFVPIAEQNGQISQLDEIVFRKVCEFIMDEKLNERGIQYLEVNLSALHCNKKNLADDYIQIMLDTGVNPAMINLEITESAAIHSKDILLENMKKLTEFGVTFSLDDFGTGYSNLNYILELPVQIVKFDRKMTNSYFENEKGRLVMQAAIEMVKAVGMHIVSEGVETKEQLEKLEQIEINYIQGFYFSKPVSGKDFLVKLRRASRD